MSNQNPTPAQDQPGERQIDAGLVIQALRDQVSDLSMKIATMTAYAQQLEMKIAKIEEREPDATK